MPKNDDLRELEAQADFLRSKLEESRKKLAKQPLVVEYDNGGGQKGTRENPEYVAYEKLLKSYHATLRAISSQTGGKPSEKRTGIGSPLMNFRDKYQNISAVKSA